MVMTPYPDSNPAYENPSVLVSDDRETWVVPDGLSNPIDSEPPVGENPYAYYSDPDMVVDNDGRMWVIYREFNGTEDIVYCKNSADGLTWGERTEIARAAYQQLVSPAIVYYGGQWIMFSVAYDGGSNSILHMRTASSITGPWSEPVVCSALPPATKYIWHIDVIADGAILFAAFNMNGNSLYLGASADGGSTWVIGADALLSQAASGWDAYLYRASIVRTSTGFDMWYSAHTNATPNVWHIGYTTIAYDESGH